MKKAIIWRESIYKNGFKCNVCGHELSATGSPNGDVLFDESEKVLYCPNCKNCVAYIKEIETDLPSGLYGDWEEFKDGQSM